MANTRFVLFNASDCIYITISIVSFNALDYIVITMFEYVWIVLFNASDYIYITKI